MRYRFDDFELDTEREWLVGASGPVVLRRQAFRMLHLLVARAPALVTRDEILDTLWGHHALSPNVVPQTISELRQALGDDPQQPRYVETRHRRGYRFMATVQRLTDDLPLSALPSLSEMSPPPPTEPESAWGSASTALQAVASGASALPAAIPGAALAAASGGAAASLVNPPQSVGVRPSAPAAQPQPSRRGLFLLGCIVLLLVWAGLGWYSRPAQPDPALETPAMPTALRLQVDDPALDADLRQRLRSLETLHLVPDGVPEDSPLGRSAWRLRVEAQGQWRLHTAVGAPPAQGTLATASVPTRTAQLMDVLATARADPTVRALPVGWPATDEGQQALAQAAAAMAAQRYPDALAAYARAAASSPAPGWVQLYSAEALVLSGRNREAAAQLAPLRRVTERGLQVQVEVLQAQLAGRPQEALAALRAQALLAPGRIEAQLAVLDVQLDLAQWSAAADTLEALALQVGESAPVLAWRRARWVAARQPAQAPAAWTWALEAANTASPALLRAARQAQVQWLLARHQLEAAWTALQSLDPSDPQRALLAGRVRLAQGDTAAAMVALREAQQQFLTRGQAGWAAQAEWGLAEGLLRQGDARLALQAATDLLTRAEASLDLPQQRRVLDLLGRIHTSRGDFGAARQVLEQAIALAGESGDALAEAMARFHLGNVHAEERQRPEEAAQAYRLAAEQFHRSGDDLWEFKALANLALMAERAGRRLDARAAYATALDRVRELGVPHEWGRIAYNAGTNERELGQLDAAARHFDEALAVFRRSGAGEGLLRVAAPRADLALWQADARRALQVLDESQSALATASPAPAAGWRVARARVAELDGDLAAAMEWLAEAQALRAGAGVRVAEIDLELRRLRLAQNAGRGWADPVQLERLESELLRLGEPKYALHAALVALERLWLQGERVAALAAAEDLRVRVQTQGNRAQQLHLDLLLALLDAGSTQSARWQALAADAEREGFQLLAQVARHAGLATGAGARLAIEQAWTTQGLAGLKTSPLRAF